GVAASLTLGEVDVHLRVAAALEPKQTHARHVALVSVRLGADLRGQFQRLGVVAGHQGGYPRGKGEGKGGRGENRTRAWGRNAGLHPDGSMLSAPRHRTGIVVYGWPRIAELPVFSAVGSVLPDLRRRHRGVL